MPSDDGSSMWDTSTEGDDSNEKRIKDVEAVEKMLSSPTPSDESSSDAEISSDSNSTEPKKSPVKSPTKNRNISDDGSAPSGLSISDSSGGSSSSSSSSKSSSSKSSGSSSSSSSSSGSNSKKGKTKKSNNTQQQTIASPSKSPSSPQKKGTLSPRKSPNVSPTKKNISSDSKSSDSSSPSISSNSSEGDGGKPTKTRSILDSSSSNGGSSSSGSSSSNTSSSSTSSAEKKKKDTASSPKPTEPTRSPEKILPSPPSKPAPSPPNDFMPPLSSNNDSADPVAEKKAVSFDVEEDEESSSDYETDTEGEDGEDFYDDDYYDDEDESSSYETATTTTDGKNQNQNQIAPPADSPQAETPPAEAPQAEAPSAKSPPAVGTGSKGSNNSPRGKDGEYDKKPQKEGRLRGPREPFTDVPSSVLADTTPIHPKSEDPRAHRRSKSDNYSATGPVPGMWDVGGAQQQEEEIIFEESIDYDTKKKEKEEKKKKKTKSRNPFRRLLNFVLSIDEDESGSEDPQKENPSQTPNQSKSRKEKDGEGESYGSKPWEVKDWNDDVSQVTDLHFAPPKKRTTTGRILKHPKGSVVSSSMADNCQKSGDGSSDTGDGDGDDVTYSNRPPSLRKTKDALSDLDPVSVDRPKSSIPLGRSRKEKRNTRSALAGLPTLSIRQNDAITDDGGDGGGDAYRPNTKTALSSLEPLSTIPLNRCGGADNHFHRSDPAYNDDIESGNSYSRGLNTSKRRLRGVPQPQSLPPQKSSNPAQASQSAEEEISVEEEVEEISPGEEVEEISAEEEGVIREVKLERAPSASVLSVPEGMSHPGSYNSDSSRYGKHRDRLDDGATRRKRSNNFFYCLLVLIILSGIAVGLWFLFDYLFDDSRNGQPPPPPVQGASPTENPVSPPSSTVSPTSTPAPNLMPTPTNSGTIVPTLPIRERLIDLLGKEMPDGGVSLMSDLVDPASPQSKALDWLEGNGRLYSFNLEKIKTRFALAALYYSTDGDGWDTNRRWLTDSDECTWYTAGLASPCTDRKYSDLILGNNNLLGFLPSELALLSNSLVSIDLGGSLSGSLPSVLGELTRLESLRINGRDIEGPIPTALASMTDLIILDLSSNRLSGSLPNQLLHSLTRLEVLDLRDNFLTGRLTTEIARLRSLITLSLGNNEFRSEIPLEMGDLDTMKTLVLDDNDFNGFLPSSIGALTSLEVLSIRNNNLAGTIPPLGTMQNLRALYLNNNNLDGDISSVRLGALTNLVDGLDLGSNSLTGAIPAELGRLTGLRNIILRDNFFVGNIPADLGDIPILHTLRLDRNNLTGFMPEQVCASFDLAESTFAVDCAEVDCTCCNFCCTDGSNTCTCPFQESQPILCIP